MREASEIITSDSLEDYKAQLREYVANLYAQGFFESEAAHQKALDNIESLTEEEWGVPGEVRREGITETGLN